MSSINRLPSFPRSGILVLESNSIQSLVPSTLISQTESLLDNHRISEAAELADQQRKKLESKISVDEDETEELRYVFQRIGFQCLSETLFSDAGKYLVVGELDPRFLVSYFPEYRGSLFAPTDEIDTYAGVVEHMPDAESMADLIMENLVRNYSPHINTREATSTAELGEILSSEARRMLHVVMLWWQRKARFEGPESKSNRKEIKMVVDTVLLRLTAENGDSGELNKIVDARHEINLPEVEPTLIESEQYNILCKLYQQRGEDAKLLDAWAKLAEGEWTDDDLPDPLSSMFTFLNEKRDRALIQRWGFWFTKRDPERGLKLLISRDAGKRAGKSEDDLVLLQRLRDASASAAAQYLEHLVLQRRSTDRGLHAQLAMTCVDQLLSCLKDDSVSKLWRAKASSYASSSSTSSQSSFLTYFASTTPDSEHKRVRLKTILLLQGSNLYDPEVVRQRLAAHEKVLVFEMAIIEGKLGRHRSALSMLMHTLHDSKSAQVYCTLGGDLVTNKDAQTIGERYDLLLWSSALIAGGSGDKAKSSGAMSRQKSVDEETRKGLLKILLEVCMSGGDSQSTARLLNSQAMNLDVLDVISLVPSDWPLHMLSTFLDRSFRRTLHTLHEGQIVKAISMGQNLEVAERTWLVVREQGAIIEELLDDDEDGGEKEKAGEVFDEKVDLLLAAHGDPDVAEIDVNEAGKEGLRDQDPTDDTSDIK